MRHPSLCHPPWPPTRLKFQQADTASEPRANRRRVMLTGLRRPRRGMPSVQHTHSTFNNLCDDERPFCYSTTSHQTLRLTYLGHDDRGGHAPPLPAVSQLGGVAGRREEFAVAEGQQVELVDRVLCLSWEDRLGKEGLGKLQGCLHYGALRGYRHRKVEFCIGNAN